MPSLRPTPQMVGGYEISADKLVYRFSLREGLKFHDGASVRGCIASLRRWMARDTFGQALATAIDDMSAAGDEVFTIRLKERFPLLIDALAKVSSLVPFIMPERLAKTDPYQQVTEMVGSGPFKFVKEEFQPGHQVVYAKNTEYIPRGEPPSWASGGKIVKVDRVEWLNIPDAMTKAAALAAGEADWWENPPFEFHPVLEANPDLVLADLSLGRDRRPALQSPAAAFRQCEDAPGGTGGCRPGRFHDRFRRRREKLETLPVILHLRHTDGEPRGRRGIDRQTRFRQSQETDRRGRLQGRKDRRARRGRSAHMLTRWSRPTS
jgi:hypothetical protein